MNNSQIHILVAIIALAVMAFLVFFEKRNRREAKLTPLASLAFAFILAGILFDDNRLTGYGLMGVGVVLAMVDMVNKSRTGE
jgi:hypothetical protein